MANHNLPTQTSTYINFVSQMDYRYDDLARGLDPATSPVADPTISNLPTNSVGWSSGNNNWRKWNGSTWVDLVTGQIYSISITGNAGTVTNGVYSIGDQTIAGIKTFSSLITGSITGNSGTTTKLATARTLNGTSFDGTINVTIPTNAAATFSSAGGAASPVTFNGTSASTISYNTVGAPSTTGTNASGSWGISITGTATNATNVAIAADTTSVGTFYIPYAVGTTGNVALKGTRLTIQPSTGNFTAEGTISANSDERLKKNWRTLPENYITKLSKIKYGIYERIDTNTTQIGVSAQSLQELLPNAVQCSSEGILSVAYGNAALVSVIELAKEVEILKEQIRLLKEYNQKGNL